MTTKPSQVTALTSALLMLMLLLLLATTQQHPSSVPIMCLAFSISRSKPSVSSNNRRSCSDSGSGGVHTSTSTTTSIIRGGSCRRDDDEQQQQQQCCQFTHRHGGSSSALFSSSTLLSDADVVVGVVAMITTSGGDTSVETTPTTAGSPVSLGDQHNNASCHNNHTNGSSSSTTKKNSNKRYNLDDGFVFGLDGSGLERPKGKQAQVVVVGDSLETQPWQVAVVWGTLFGHAGFMVSSLMGMLHVNQGNVLWTAVQAMLLFVSSWTLADFGSGVLHWSVDNYGNGRTPIMGGIIAAFQGHHSAPWTITQRGFANNVYKLCIPFGVITVGLFQGLLNLLTTGGQQQHPFAIFFFAVFCAMEILSQEFHKWSHTTKKEVPPWVNTVQNWGWTIGRKPHAQHHIAPYDGNYCIISGICNVWLDESGFFRRLEHIVYMWNGVESNAWKLDAALRERTLHGDYRLESSID